MLGPLGVAVVAAHAFPTDGSGEGGEPLAASIGEAKRLVTAVGADLGAVFDRPGERIYLIDEQAREIPVDQALLLYLRLIGSDGREGKLAFPSLPREPGMYKLAITEADGTNALLHRRSRRAQAPASRTIEPPDRRSPRTSGRGRGKRESSSSGSGESPTPPPAFASAAASGLGKEASRSYRHSGSGWPISSPIPSLCRSVLTGSRAGSELGATCPLNRCESPRCG